MKKSAFYNLLDTIQKLTRGQHILLKYDGFLFRIPKVFNLHILSQYLKKNCEKETD